MTGYAAAFLDKGHVCLLKQRNAALNRGIDRVALWGSDRLKRHGGDQGSRGDEANELLRHFVDPATGPVFRDRSPDYRWRSASASYPWAREKRMCTRTIAKPESLQTTGRCCNSSLHRPTASALRAWCRL